MVNSDIHHRTTNFLNYLGIILISGLFVIMVIWLANSITAHQADDTTAQATRYVELLEQWLQRESRDLTTEQRHAIAECAYQQDPDLILYRDSQLYLQKSRSTTIDPLLEEDFLDELEKFINGSNGNLLQAETERIKSALNTCKTENHV